MGFSSVESLWSFIPLVLGRDLLIVFCASPAYAVVLASVARHVDNFVVALLIDRYRTVMDVSARLPGRFGSLSGQVPGSAIFRGIAAAGTFSPFLYDRF